MRTRRTPIGIALLCAIAMLCLPALALGEGAKGKAEIPYSPTWWCADLNDVWNVKVPLIGPRVWAVPPDPTSPDVCTVIWPSPVPEGSSFAPGNVIWFTNKTYPPASRAALEEMGYHFHSQSPAEDFMSKIAEIRVEVWTYPPPEVDPVLIGEHRFDPRKVFRLVRVRELFFGPGEIGPIVNPELGIDLSAEEVGRLPLFGFPVILPPPGAPGEYRIRVYLTMSEWHNDGTCLEESCTIEAGEVLWVTPRLTVVP